MYSVLFVCMGNICRSPTAEAVFSHLLADSDLAGQVSVDSAGTIGYHVGEQPDRRAQVAARSAGYSMEGIYARQIRATDLDDFDLILVMDQDNLQNTRSAFNVAGKSQQEIEEKVRLFLSYATNHSDTEVPDPYYGGERGFKYVIELIEDASRGLIRDLKTKLV